jgi:3-dehydroquinate synthase
MTLIRYSITDSWQKKKWYGTVQFALIEGIGKIKINQSVENELILEAFNDYKS